MRPSGIPNSHNRIGMSSSSAIESPLVESGGLALFTDRVCETSEADVGNAMQPLLGKQNFLAALDRLRALSLEHGFRVIVVPYFASRSATDGSSVHIPYFTLPGAGISNLAFLLNACRERGFEIADPEPLFARERSEHGLAANGLWLAPSDSHPNAVGHRHHRAHHETPSAQPAPAQDEQGNVAQDDHDADGPAGVAVDDLGRAADAAGRQLARHQEQIHRQRLEQRANQDQAIVADARPHGAGSGARVGRRQIGLEHQAHFIGRFETERGVYRAPGIAGVQDDHAHAMLAAPIQGRLGQRARQPAAPVGGPMIDPRFYVSLGPLTVRALAPAAEIGGDAEQLVSSAAPADRAGPSDICYYEGKGGALCEPALLCMHSARAEATDGGRRLSLGGHATHAKD